MYTYNVRIWEEKNIAKFDYETNDLKVGTDVIIETENGSEWGVIAAAGKAKPAKAPDNAQILRPANEKDERQIAVLRKSAQYAIEKTTEMVEKFKLDMKVMSAHYSFDATKVVIYFAAEQRVDFRELVRNLAGVLHTRIELRQIGARDEVKAIGGLGPCGQECCCSRFCHHYPEVSIKMAKQQNISLTPEKINGVCGRLKCCLSYEYDK